MNNDVFRAFIENSYLLLQNYEKNERYFHKLTHSDNSPTVVHKKTNQLTYVIRGSGYIWLDGVQLEISKGMPIFIPANTCHRFAANEEELTLFHIHIPDEGREIDREIIEGADYHRFR